jgi:hypothetical protein
MGSISENHAHECDDLYPRTMWPSTPPWSLIFRKTYIRPKPDIITTAPWTAARVRGGMDRIVVVPIIIVRAGGNGRCRRMVSASSNSNIRRRRNSLIDNSYFVSLPSKYNSVVALICAISTTTLSRRATGNGRHCPNCRVDVWVAACSRVLSAPWSSLLHSN